MQSRCTADIGPLIRAMVSGVGTPFSVLSDGLGRRVDD
ncbi:MAG: hypothetical protein ACI9W2_002906 [Gammaproteobacteria bacterium]|jgi:hypothetical protein